MILFENSIKFGSFRIIIKGNYLLLDSWKGETTGSHHSQVHQVPVSVHDTGAPAVLSHPTQIRQPTQVRLPHIRSRDLYAVKYIYFDFDKLISW